MREYDFLRKGGEGVCDRHLTKVPYDNVMRGGVGTLWCCELYTVLEYYD